MAYKYLTNLDLNQNELQNAVLHPLGTAPSNPVEGQIYYNSGSNAIFVYDGTQWINISGDITEVIAGDGLTGGGNSGSVTVDVNTDGSTIETSGDAIRVKASGITSNELNSTGVTSGSYGSSTAIPTFTVDEDGRLTTAGTASISTDLTISDGTNTDIVSLGTDTLTFSSVTNETEISVTNNNVTIGLPNDVTIGNNLIVTGDLTVSGTSTIVNTETILLADNVITLNSNAAGTPTENAGIEVERGDAANVFLRWNETTDVWEFTNDGTNYATIGSSNDNFKASIGDGVATSYAITHNLNSTDIMVQLFENATGDTVIADVTRTSANVATISFTQAPSASEIRVLITKI